MKDDWSKVKVKWGDSQDKYDPIGQTTNVTVRLEYQTPIDNGEIVDQCLQPNVPIKK